MRGPAPLLLVCAFAVASVAAQAARDVTIRAPDGFALAARLHASPLPGPGVLLLHQCNRTGDDTGLESLASALAARGMHALELDMRGFGDSRDARFPDYRSQERLIDSLVGGDVQAALDFLESQPGVIERGVGVVGASCGTWQAIPLARDNPRILALVFLSGSYLGLGEVESDYAAITDRPVLAIYSETDRYGTPDSMRAAFAASRHPASRLIAYKGDLHGAPLLRHDPELEGTITAWFDEQLEAPASR